MDLYGILGVARNATNDEIKAAHRRLARMTHPDINNGSYEDFLSAQAAYEVLSDNDRRERYDQTGDITEPPKEDLVRKQAIGLLSELMASIMMHDQEPFRTDLCKAMREAITAQINSMEPERHKHQRARDRLDKLKGRFMRKGKDGDSIIEGIMRSHAQRLDEVLAQMASRRQVAELAVALLADYDFAQETQAPTGMQQASLGPFAAATNGQAGLGKIFSW